MVDNPFNTSTRNRNPRIAIKFCASLGKLHLFLIDNCHRRMMENGNFKKKARRLEPSGNCIFW
jgi:hypothetical protein